MHGCLQAFWFLLNARKNRLPSSDSAVVNLAINLNMTAYPYKTLLCLLMQADVQGAIAVSGGTASLAMYGL